MKKSIFLFEKLINSKAFKGLDEETQATLRDVVEGEADTDLSEEDIKELISENAELKETVSNLEAKLKEAECGRTMDKIESIVEKAVDELNPLTPTVKENILRDINLDDLKMEDGQIAGLDDVLNGIKEKYDGLFAKADDAEGKEPDTDDEDKESGDEEDKDKEEVVKKSVKNKSGIRFSAGTNEKSADRVVRNGRTFK